MELKLGVVFAGYFEHPFTFSEENRLFVAVKCDGSAFAAEKLFKHLFVCSGNPECLVVSQGAEVALGIVFVLQTEFDDIELQFSDGADDFAVAELDEELGEPSSVSWRMPLSSCFCFMGSRFSSALKISGEKLGMPRKCSSSPSVSVSPILSDPLSYRPMTSPGQASSMMLFSFAMKWVGLEKRTFFCSRVWV